MDMVWGSLDTRAWSRVVHRTLDYEFASAASEPLGFWLEKADDCISVTLGM